MQLLLTLVVVAAGSVAAALPERVTPIADLDTVAGLQHEEVLQVGRDFGQPNVNVAVDAWLRADDPRRIDGVRVWWSDEVDRYPFSEEVLRHLAIEYRQLKPDQWRIAVGGGRRRFAFDVAVHEGRPALFADVVLRGGRVVRHCRAASARLRARRVFGIPAGLQSLDVTCTADDGAVHQGHVRMQAATAPRPAR
jgi:hypothetical protein